MNIEQLALQKLEALKVQHAMDSLTQPSRRDMFEYGERVGILKGLNLATEVIMALIEELKRTDE